MTKPGTVDRYITALPPIARRYATRMRSIIRQCAPGATETISYGVPGYDFHGRLVYFGAFKNHISLFGAGRKLTVDFAAQGYKTSKGTVQFPYAERLPVHLIMKAVQGRVRENIAKSKK